MNKRQKKWQKPSPPTCEKTGKVRFRSFEQALEVLIKQSRYHKKEKVPIRSYLCHYCNGIHLTSQTYKTVEERKEKNGK